MAEDKKPIEFVPVEVYQQERASLLAAFAAKYASIEEAHPDKWVIHRASDSACRWSQDDRINRMCKLLTSCPSQRAMELLFAYCVAASPSPHLSTQNPHLYTFQPGDMFVIDKHAVKNKHPAEVRWWVGGDTYVSAADVTEALGKNTLAENQAIVYKHFASIKDKCWYILHKFSDELKDILWQHFARPDILASDKWSRFEELLKACFFDLVPGNTNVACVLASPYATLDTELQPHYEGDYESQGFARGDGTFYSVAINTLTLKLVITDKLE